MQHWLFKLVVNIKLFSLLEKLYEFLESEPPLNPLLASYFSKIIGGLVAKKTEQVSICFLLYGGFMLGLYVE